MREDRSDATVEAFALQRQTSLEIDVVRRIEQLMPGIDWLFSVKAWHLLRADGLTYCGVEIEGGDGATTDTGAVYCEPCRVAKAVEDGYPDVDQTCSKCQRVFKNYHHFVRCQMAGCPMTSGKSLLDMMRDSLEDEAKS